jgi:acetyl esterase/lipase
MLIQDASPIAVNYRLAPQYPFPCAIQDLLAACEQYCTVLLKHEVLKNEVIRPFLD